MSNLENKENLVEYTTNLSELKNKLFDSEQYNTLIISTEGELQGGFDKFFDFISKRENVELKQDALSIFKQEVSVEGVIDFLNYETDRKKRVQILCAVWEADLDATKNIMYWVDCAIKGSYEECIEVLSIIENIETTIPNIELVQAQEKLALAKGLDENEDKAGLLDALENALDFLKEN